MLRLNGLVLGLTALAFVGAQSGCSVLQAVGIGALSKKSSSSSSNSAPTKSPSGKPLPKTAQIDDDDFFPDDEHCQKWAQSTGAIPRNSYLLRGETTDEGWVLAIACHKTFSSYEADKSLYASAHFTFDERNPKHLDLAIGLAVCYGTENCEGPIATGLMGLYAKILDEKKVSAEVARLKLDDDVKRVFTARYQAAKALIMSRLAELDERRMELYHNLPAALLEKRAAHNKEYATFWQRYDELMPQITATVRKGESDPKLIEKALTLRDDYVVKCLAKSKEDPGLCIHGPIARPLTEAVTRLAVMGKMPMLAHAENFLLEQSTERASWGAAVYYAQYSAMAAERKRYDEYARAKRDGVDEATLEGMFGSPAPIKIDAAASWRPPRQKTNFASLIRNLKPAPTSAAGTVKSIKRRGAMAEVKFQTIVSKWVENDCVETNRIDRIDDNGNIVYRKKCKYKKTHTDKRTPKSIKVPAQEVAGLKKGDFVNAVVAEDTRQGYVLTAYSDDKRKEAVQLRRYRLQ